MVAWCLMPNHVHLIAVPARSDSLSILLRRVHGRYAQMVNARKVRTGRLWQSRFYSCALSPNHLQRALAYVERNPVRAGMAGSPQDYRWSSAAVHLGLAKDRYGLLDMNFWREQGGAAGWSKLLTTPEQSLDLRLLRRSTYAGRPFGEEEFVALFEERFGRVWRKWGFEKESAAVQTFAI